MTTTYRYEVMEGDNWKRLLDVINERGSQGWRLMGPLVSIVLPDGTVRYIGTVEMRTKR